MPPVSEAYDPADAQAEQDRLDEDARRAKNWKRWGSYLSERQWGTVREDYSADGSCWTYFPHDVSRSRAYRWGEDGLLGICDRECRLCFAVALWNGRDPILKERLFGLTNPQGNHGEDVKECYYYLEALPTHAWMRAQYKYPQAEFPYTDLVQENARRTRQDEEYELVDTGVFDESRYFDVIADYAKAGPNDVLIRLTIHNRGPDPAEIHLLPTLWFRNTWSWGETLSEDANEKPALRQLRAGVIEAQHETLGKFEWHVELPSDQDATSEVHRSSEKDLSSEKDISSEKDAAAKASPAPAKGSPGAAPSDSASPGPASSSSDARAPAPAQARQFAAGGRLIFTENNANGPLLFGEPHQPGDVYKDAFHHYVVDGDASVVAADAQGTKAAALLKQTIAPGESCSVRLRLFDVRERPAEVFGPGFDQLMRQRRAEWLAHTRQVIGEASPTHLAIARQAYAGLLWSKQFYHYVVSQWIAGDPKGRPPPPERIKHVRNADWQHLFNRDVVSMPDKWEYPWYAAWDLAFHMIPMARLDADFAKDQLILMLREWYMHPNGQIPAYEFNFSDVNPPVHAWACWRVYKMTGPEGGRDRQFLARAFQKLMLNFTWWVNRKDAAGRNLFGGGFLGLDNIGVFDRSHALPGGQQLEQADGTAWMAFFCGTMLSMALELAAEDPVYEDVASKFFEHFVAIVDAMNSLGGHGLWDEQDGFYYDQIRAGDEEATPLRMRTLVGVIPLFAAEILDPAVMKKLPGFCKRMRWFIGHRPDLRKYLTGSDSPGRATDNELLLAIPTRERLVRVLKYVLDEKEFLSPFGVRSLSKIYGEASYTIDLEGQTYSAAYDPGVSRTDAFGGNSNWRGPIWFPLNYLLIEALERYQFFYKDTLKVECPTGSGNMHTLGEVACELRRRLVNLFQPDAAGHRPSNGNDPRYASDPHWRDLILFNEYFHGDTGAGLGASHQTGWTALVSELVRDEG